MCNEFYISDVAIGAPWENENSGVVYIYKGYAKGLRSQYTQRIIAEGAGSFGISIAKGFDVDSNNCNGKGFWTEFRR